MRGSEKSASGNAAAKQGSPGRAWFQLTVSEQKAVAVVLALVLLGILVKGWRSIDMHDGTRRVQLEEATE